MSAFDEDIDPLPTGINEADMVAELINTFPDYVAENRSLVEFMSLIMLKYRNYDMVTATKRLSNYLSWRKSLFGNLDDHTMENDAKLGGVMKMGFFQTILPPKGEGPMILYIRARLGDNTKFETMDIVKVWHYLIISGMKRDNEIARHGIIVINNLEDAGFNNIDRGVPSIIGPAVNNCMPIRLVSACLFNASWILSGFVSVVKLIFSSKMQKRIHSISDPSWFLTELKVPPARLPKELGGEYVVVEGEDYQQIYSDLHLTI